MSKEFADCITGNNPAFLKMRERGNFKRGGHGTSYVESFYFPTLTGPQVEDIDNPYDEPEAQQTDGMTSFSFTRCEKEIDISVPLYTLEAQGPDTEKYEAVQTVTEINMAKFEENLNANFWAIPEGTYSAGSRKRLASIRTLINGGNATTTGGAVPASLTEQDGLRALVSASGATAVYTIGGINRAAVGASYICPNIRLTSETIDIEVLSHPYSAATRGADHPDLILVAPVLFDSIMGFSTFTGSNGGQMFGPSKLADIGYDAIRFRGADIVADHNVPTAGFLSTTTTALGYQAFYLNTKYIRMRYQSMKPEVRQVTGGAAPIKRWRARFTGQLTVRNPGRVQSIAANLVP